MTEKTHARKMLELIEARLEGRLLQAHNEYSINGRSMKLMTVPELMVARSKYAIEVQREDAAANGGGFRKRIYTRL